MSQLAACLLSRASVQGLDTPCKVSQQPLVRVTLEGLPGEKPDGCIDHTPILLSYMSRAEATGLAIRILE